MLKRFTRSPCTTKSSEIMLPDISSAQTMSMPLALTVVCALQQTRLRQRDDERRQHQPAQRGQHGAGPGTPRPRQSFHQSHRRIKKRRRLAAPALQPRQQRQQQQQQQKIGMRKSHFVS